MVDWLMCRIKFRHPRIESGHRWRTDKYGVLIQQNAVRERYEGSYESTISLVSNDITECRDFGESLFIDGNITKFLQGHNIVGIDDLNLLLCKFMESLCKTTGWDFYPEARQAIMRGDYVVKRIDLNHNFELSSMANVEPFLQALEQQCRSMAGRASRVQNTVFFNQRSKRWAFKFYNKFIEIVNGGKKHAIPHVFMDSPLLEWSRTKIRAELVMRARELVTFAQTKDQYTDHCYGYHLQDNLIDIFDKYLGRIHMAGQVTLQSDKLHQLPNHLIGIYTQWEQGLNLKANYKKSTFYRHRKQLLEHADIDIALPCTIHHETQTNVVQLKRIIDVQRVHTLPDKFFELGLVAC